MQAEINGQSVEICQRPMRHHTMNRTYTRTGYGMRIPTQYMVKFNQRWRRVYCCQFANNGTLYIGKLATSQTVNIYTTEAS